ncbi:MAG: hypothetical protein V1800_02420 [Candidatus Latescibacterota bacterium]
MQEAPQRLTDPLGNKMMGKLESWIIGLFLGIACPVLTFTAFWWSAAFLYMRVPGSSPSRVIASAVTGLCLGILLDAFFLRRWVRRFYSAHPGSLILLHLGLTPIAVALFMGFPVGTIILGIGAGAAMGRRAHHRHMDEICALLFLRKTACLAASVTTVAALPIGVLALREQHILEMLESVSGVDATRLRGFFGLALIGLLCLVLFVTQYGLTRKAGLLAFAWGSGKALRRGPAQTRASRD